MSYTDDEVRAIAQEAGRAALEQHTAAQVERKPAADAAEAPRAKTSDEVFRDQLAAGTSHWQSAGPVFPPPSDLAFDRAAGEALRAAIIADNAREGE